MAYIYRGLAFLLQDDFDKAWDDVKKTQALGAQFPPKFLKMLREASGRERWFKSYIFTWVQARTTAISPRPPQQIFSKEYHL